MNITFLFNFQYLILQQQLFSMSNLILFASGAGSNVQAIINYFETSDTPVTIKCIVCNKPEAGVLKIAENHNIPVEMITKTSFNEAAFVATMESYQPDMLILAGFLWKIPELLVKAFPNKIINIHPALLPKYGGKGMYGHHVHEAVVAAKEQESGITIHYVNEHYDEGATIVQAHCKVTSEDTPDDVAHKIHKLEHHFFPRTIEFLLKK